MCDNNKNSLENYENEKNAKEILNPLNVPDELIDCGLAIVVRTLDQRFYAKISDLECSYFYKCIKTNKSLSGNFKEIITYNSYEIVLEFIKIKNGLITKSELEIKKLFEIYLIFQQWGIQNRTLIEHLIIANKENYTLLTPENYEKTLELIIQISSQNDLFKNLDFIILFNAEKEFDQIKSTVMTKFEEHCNMLKSNNDEPLDMEKIFKLLLKKKFYKISHDLNQIAAKKENKIKKIEFISEFCVYDIYFELGIVHYYSLNLCPLDSVLNIIINDFEKNQEKVNEKVNEKNNKTDDAKLEEYKKYICDQIQAKKTKVIISLKTWKKVENHDFLRNCLDKLNKTKRNIFISIDTSENKSEKNLILCQKNNCMEEYLDFVKGVNDEKINLEVMKNCIFENSISLMFSYIFNRSAFNPGNEILKKIIGILIMALDQLRIECSNKIRGVEDVIGFIIFREELHEQFDFLQYLLPILYKIKESPIDDNFKKIICKFDMNKEKLLQLTKYFPKDQVFDLFMSMNHIEIYNKNNQVPIQKDTYIRLVEGRN